MYEDISVSLEKQITREGKFCKISKNWSGKDYLINREQ